MEFTQEELKAIREEWCPGSNDSQFELFISEAKARNLRPGTHLFFMLRNTNEWDSTIGAKVRKSKATWITKIDAFRLISQRTGKDAGRGKTRWIYLDDNNSPSIESTIPLPHKSLAHVPREPYACVVPIYRSDYKEPIEIVCRFDAYAVTMRSGDGTVLTEMWQRRGPEQLEKCTEASTRRAAYPEEFGSLYLAEEFSKEEEATPTAPSEPVAILPAPTAPVVPKVNHVPAEPTQTPRPTEAPLPTLNEIILHKEPTAPPSVPAVVPELINALEKTISKGKRGPKGKGAIPDNGKSSENRGVTDEDINNIGTPAPAFDEAANKKAAEEFAEDVCSATPVPDRMPDEDQKKKYTARIRALVAEHKVDSKALGVYVVTTLSGKSKTSDLTVGDWDNAFAKLDAAVAADKTAEQKALDLRELVKPNA